MTDIDANCVISLYNLSIRIHEPRECSLSHAEITYATANIVDVGGIVVIVAVISRIGVSNVGRIGVGE